MPEFIRVLFPNRRRVIVDGGPNGFSGDVVMVSRGPHRVTLGPPPNFSPTFRLPNVAGTTATSPMPIAFSSPATDASIGGPPAPPVPAARQRKRVRRRKASHPKASRASKAAAKTSRKRVRKPRHK